MDYFKKQAKHYNRTRILNSPLLKKYSFSYGYEGTAVYKDPVKAAKDISSKYIMPPATTEFAIMFLPFEGLYAEVLRQDIVETLQRDYRVTIAGPTTMAAMLNSFRMGFRSLALQKHSGEVWNTLAKVKTEFDKFGDVLTKTQTKMEQAQKDLETLVGVRTRGIQRALKNVSNTTEYIDNFDE